MLNGEQLELDVSTIQPGEVYVLYTDVMESWDAVYKAYRGDYDDDDYAGICHRPSGSGCMTRATVHEKMLTGVIVDDHSLAVVKGRMEEYARNWEEEARRKNAGSVDKPNFDIKVSYILEKERRIVL